MTNSLGQSIQYPLLEVLLHQKGLDLKGIYTIRDVAQIFGASKRTVQDWVHDGGTDGSRFTGSRKISIGRPGAIS